MPPRKAQKKQSPPKPLVAEKKQYCGGLKPNDIDGELFWADDRAKSSSQFAARYLAHEEKDIMHNAVKSDSRSSSKLIEHHSTTNTFGYIAESTRGPAANLHKVMTSSQPIMDHDEREEFYARTYPYNYLHLVDLKDTSASVERVYTIQEFTGSEQSKTMEAVILSLRYLENTEHQTLNRCIFIDLMAQCGEAVLYASAFGFSRLITLELSEDSKSEAIRIIGQIPLLSEKVTVLIGSFHDYFPCDAQVYYCDLCRVVNPRGMMDEGVLVNKLFSLFENLLPGVFLILITWMPEFSASKDFKAPWMKRLLKATVHHGLPDESTLWIYGLDFS